MVQHRKAYGSSESLIAERQGPTIPLNDVSIASAEAPPERMGKSAVDLDAENVTRSLSESICCHAESGPNLQDVCTEVNAIQGPRKNAFLKRSSPE